MLLEVVDQATGRADDDVDGAVDVFVRDLDDGTTRRVPSGSGDAPGWITADPALSADGSVVVVTSRDAEGSPAELLLHEIDDEMIATTERPPASSVPLTMPPSPSSVEYVLTRTSKPAASRRSR